MRYIYRCDKHHVGIHFEIESPIVDGPPKMVSCPLCGEDSVREWHPIPVRWDTSGAHGQKGSHIGDYDSDGDKLEKFNKNWSKHYNEEPPEPAKDVPRNQKGPY